MQVMRLEAEVVQSRAELCLQGAALEGAQQQAGAAEQAALALRKVGKRV